MCIVYMLGLSCTIDNEKPLLRMCRGDYSIVVVCLSQSVNHLRFKLRAFLILKRTPMWSRHRWRNHGDSGGICSSYGGINCPHTTLCNMLMSVYWFHHLCNGNPTITIQWQDLRITDMWDIVLPPYVQNHLPPPIWYIYENQTVLNFAIAYFVSQ